MIGHHLLEGKVANLNKPLAVLKRPGSVAQNTTTGEMDMMDDPQHHPQDSVSWDMIAIVKRKIVFSKRPMPIVNLKPPSSVGNGGDMRS
jgi:chromosome transmission fidelity protein 8